MTRPRIIFAGTPDFSVPCLDALYRQDLDIVAVYCQPDRPAGRGRATQACAVKQCAEHLGLEIRQPKTLKSGDAIGALRQLNADLMIVAAYGLILPDAVLTAPSLGCVNVHASLLPRWRGAAPIQRAIEAGDPVTGITLMQMDRGLDTGDMLYHVTTPITPADTGDSLHDRLSDMGAHLLVESLPSILRGETDPEIQDNGLATYAAKIDREEANIDWSADAESLSLRVRAFNPWPVCRTTRAGEVLRIWSALAIGREPAHLGAGTVLTSSSSGLEVQCGTGVLRILECQKPGGKCMAIGEFLNGTPIAAGQILGT